MRDRVAVTTPQCGKSLSSAVFDTKEIFRPNVQRFWSPRAKEGSRDRFDAEAYYCLTDQNPASQRKLEERERERSVQIEVLDGLNELALKS